MTMSEVVVEHPQPGVAVVRMQAPERKNAYTGPFARELKNALDSVASDSSIAAMILTGGQAFCAGAHRDLLAGAGAGDAACLADLEDVYATFDALRDVGAVTVAAVCGPAVGAGLNLALACDVRVVATDAYLRSMFLANSIHPGGGHLRMLLDCAGPQATTVMAILDEPVDGAEALRLGLAHASVPAAEAESTALTMVRRAADQPELARLMKRSMAETAAIAPRSAAVIEGRLQARTLRAKHFART